MILVSVWSPWVLENRSVSSGATGLRRPMRDAWSRLFDLHCHILQRSMTAPRRWTRPGARFCVQDGITRNTTLPSVHPVIRHLAARRALAHPHGDGLKFTLSEVDLRQEAMFVYLEVESVAVDPAWEPRFRTSNQIQHYRIRMLTREGCQSTAPCHQGGALTKENRTVTFSLTGKRGAVVMEFPSQEDPTTF
jgi:hypothetical protein